MKTILLAGIASFALAAAYVTMPAREGIVTCNFALYAVDGDTIRCDAQLMRDMGNGAPNISGYDAPEIFKPKCAEELSLGIQAKIRLDEIIKTGVKIYYSGVKDHFNRPLVWVAMHNGPTAGSILIEEGLARPWYKGYRADWCSNG